MNENPDNGYSGPQGCLNRPSHILYLACPYSHPQPHVRRHRHDVANLAAAKLISRGFVVFSPLSHSHPIAETGMDGSWETWERQCLALLDVCSHMLVLTVEGWGESVGLQAEMDHCQKTGKTVIFSSFDKLDSFSFDRLPVNV